MQNKTHIPVQITSLSGKKTSGVVDIQTWDKKAKTLRAIKFFAACWALSIISIALPIAHFFLVPGFFIAGPIGAYWIAQQKSVVLGGQGSCPNCGETLPIVRSPDRWPLTDLCVKCHTSVSIEKKNEL